MEKLAWVYCKMALAKIGEKHKGAHSNPENKKEPYLKTTEQNNTNRGSTTQTQNLQVWKNWR